MRRIVDDDAGPGRLGDGDEHLGLRLAGGVERVVEPVSGQGGAADAIRTADLKHPHHHYRRASSQCSRRLKGEAVSR